MPAKEGLPHSGSLMNMSTGNAAAPKDRAAALLKEGLPHSGSLMNMSTGNAAAPKDRAAALFLKESVFADLGIVFLRRHGVVTEKGTIKTGIIVEAALFGGVARCNAVLHQMLGIGNPFIENILMDRDVGIVFEVVQKGIFAEVEALSQRIQGERFQNMIVDVPDDIVDAFRRMGIEHLFSLHDAADDQGKHLDAAAVHLSETGFLIIILINIVINQADKAGSAEAVGMERVVPCVNGVFNDVKNGIGRIGHFAENLAGGVKIGSFIGHIGVGHIRPMQGSRRENKQVHGMGVKALVLDDDLRISADEEVKLVMRMHMKLAGFPSRIEGMGTAGVGTDTDVVRFLKGLLIHSGPP